MSVLDRPSSLETNRNYLRDHKSGLVLPVDVSVRVTRHFLAGLHERQHQRALPRRFLHGQQPAGPVVRRPGPGQVRVAVVLRLGEVLQYLAVAPSDVAHVAPPVVVVPVAPDVQHVVQHARTAQHFAPGPVAPAVLQAQARFACENNDKNDHNTLENVLN